MLFHLATRLCFNKSSLFQDRNPKDETEMFHEIGDGTKVKCWIRSASKFGTRSRFSFPLLISRPARDAIQHNAGNDFPPKWCCEEWQSINYSANSMFINALEVCVWLFYSVDLEWMMRQYFAWRILIQTNVVHQSETLVVQNLTPPSSAVLFLCTRIHTIHCLKLYKKNRTSGAQ